MPKSLASLPAYELAQLRNEVENEIAERTAELQHQLDLISGSQPTAFRASVKRDPRAGRKLAAKYRGPGGATWSGRGLRPRWLTAAIAAGRKLEDFALKRRGQPARAKRPTAKK